MEEALFFREDSGNLFIKAQGHITAALCTDLKMKVFDRLDSGIEVHDVFVDLGDCTYMDSTFMGLIVGMNKRLMKTAKKPVTVQNMKESCTELLQNIGILKLLTVLAEPVTFPVAMENMCQGQKATAEFLLDVHENLMEISPENQQRFHVLHTVLSGQVKQESSQEGIEKK